jgi:hypothetical protein
MLDVLVDRPVQRWILLGHRADRRQHRQRCTIGHARQQPRLRRLAAVAHCCRKQEQHVVAERVVVTQALFDALAGIGRRCRKRDRGGAVGARCRCHHTSSTTRPAAPRQP